MFSFEHALNSYGLCFYRHSLRFFFVFDLRYTHPVVIAIDCDRIRGLTGLAACITVQLQPGAPRRRCDESMAQQGPQSHYVFTLMSS